MDGNDETNPSAESAGNEAERLQALLDAPPTDEPADDAGDGPAEAQVTAEQDEGEGADDPAEPPVIGAPESWPAEARQRFAELPPDLQRVIADREAEQKTAFNRQVNEAADRRKAAEAELQAASTERRHYSAQLSTMVDALAQQTAAEFADIKTPSDLEQLAASDPQRYLRWQARRDALAAAGAEQARLLERQSAEQTARLHGYVAEQRRLLLEKLPELKDPKAATALQAEMSDYLRGLGFSDQELESWLDHRYALVIRDAVRYRRGQQAARSATEKKVAHLPRLQRPGAGSDPRAERSAQERAAMTRIARHGTTDQQAEALTRLLEGK
jgi:hypothetical protein